MRPLYRLLILLPIIAVAAFISGCTDELGLVDFSGELPLEMTNDSWPYRIIQETDFNNFFFAPGSRLSDEQAKLELNQTWKIGSTDYLFANLFGGGYSPFGKYELDETWGFHTNVYNYSNHSRVKTFIISQSDSGDSWNRVLDDGDDEANHYLKRSGECELTFFDRNTDCDYIVKSVYSLAATAERKKNEKGQFVLDDSGNYKYDRVFTTGSSKITIGMRKCLVGEKNIVGKVIRFYVLDWNLDGEFTEDDTVYCDFHNTFYDFGKTIRLNNSNKASMDNKYVFKLLKPSEDNGDYRLQLELVEKGIREK